MLALQRIIVTTTTAIATITTTTTTTYSVRHSSYFDLLSCDSSVKKFRQLAII